MLIPFATTEDFREAEDRRDRLTTRNRKKIENTLYSGPLQLHRANKGLDFGFLHHGQLCEELHNGAMSALIM